MKRPRSPRPPRGSCGRTARSTRSVLDSESETPPCWTRPGAQSSSDLSLPSAAAGILVSDQPTGVEDEVTGESSGAAAEAASSKSRRHCAGGKRRHREDNIGPPAEEHNGRSVHAQEPAEELGRKAWARTVDAQDAGPPCARRAISPGKSSEWLAAESMYEADTGASDDHTERQWLTQQQAGEEFCLSVQTLRDAANEGLLKVEKRTNPHGATYAPMRLYQRCDLRRLAFQIWGDETGVEKERERRREQRWQQRQQRMSSVLCDSAAPATGGTGTSARSRRSLPDLRTFLRSSSKRKRERTQHSGSLRRTTAVHPAGRETDEKLSTFHKHRSQQAASQGLYCTAGKASAATPPSAGLDKASARTVEANAPSRPGDVCGHAHSVSSEEIVWEEV